MYTWLNALAKNTWHCCAYQENNKQLFKKIPTGKPTPTLEDFKRKLQNFD